MTFYFFLFETSTYLTQKSQGDVTSSKPYHSVKSISAGCCHDFLKRDVVGVVRIQSKICVLAVKSAFGVSSLA